MFAVTYEYLQEYDQQRVVKDPEAKPGRNVNRKRQLETYNKYKDDLRLLAKEMRFVMPHGYFAIWFYVPCPPSWRKKKVMERLYMPHQSTPDCDNLIKAFLDAVCPRKNKAKGEKGNDDRQVHCYAAFKVWVKPEDSCIKVLEYDSAEFVEAFKDGYPTL